MTPLLNHHDSAVRRQRNDVDPIRVFENEHFMRLPGARVNGRADVLLVPGDRNAGGLEDGADGVGDLGADAFLILTRLRFFEFELRSGFKRGKERYGK